MGILTPGWRVATSTTAGKRQDAPEVLQIYLLGGCRVTQGTSLVEGIDTPRLQSLLTYLLLRRGAPQSRQHLAFLLWADSTEAQARTNLRQLLHLLKRALPDADRFVRSDSRTLRWRDDAPCWSDIEEFERLIEGASGGPDSRRALERAVALYEGDLLPGCYEDWIQPARDRLHHAFSTAVDRLVREFEGERDYRSAVRYAERLVRHDPLDEEAHRRLVHLHAIGGERAQALRAYHACVTTLKRELGVEPGTALRELHARLLETDEQAPTPSSPPIAEAAPFVGRRAEWRTLEGAWRAASKGRFTFALVSGEAGIGKTRLLEELRHWTARQGARTAHARGFRGMEGLSYAPLAEWLRSEAVRGPWRSLLPEVWLGEVSRVVPEILVDHPRLPPPGPLTENWQRLRLFEALARALLAGGRPLFLVLDDLPWCDTDTLDWLRYFERYDGAAPVLFAATARTEDLISSPWASFLTEAPHRLRFELEALDRVDTEALAAHVAGRAPGAEETARLHRQTGGNPLFVVETLRAGRADGSIPPKVQEVISARLARLSPAARELTEVASMVGSRFTPALLAKAGEADERTVVRAIDELWTRRLFREQANDEYDFTHDRIREVAGAGLSRARRQFLHRRIAEALEALHSVDLDPVSVRIAVHFDEAGAPDRALAWYERAAAVAQRVAANEEAIVHLRRAASLLERTAADRVRDERELSLKLALGVPLVAQRGYGAPDVTAVYEDARALCARLGKPDSPPVLRALTIAYLVRGELARAHELGSTLLTCARENPHPVLEVEARYVLGVTAFWMGRFGESQDELKRALRGFKAEHRTLHLAKYAQDPQVICLVRLAITLWHLGLPDEALVHARRACELAEEGGHRYSLAYALHWTAWLHALRREPAETLGAAERSVDFSAGQGFAYWHTQGAVLRGWARGDAAEMRRGLDAFRATGTEVGRPYFLGLLAEVLAEDGKLDEGLVAIGEALASVEKRGERWPEAELWRWKGDLLRARRSRSEESREAYQRALGIARIQGARWMELRAVVGLIRLGAERESLRQLKTLLGRIRDGRRLREFAEARSFLRKA